MHSLLHSLNIGTLATWLSVAGFGGVGVIVKPWQQAPAEPVAVEMLSRVEDFTLGDTESSAVSELADTVFSELSESLPAPPELAPLAEIAPLPEVPALPELPQRPSYAAAAAEPGPQVRSTARGSATSRSGTSSTVSAGRSGAGATGAAASGISSAARLAAGRMPAPSYPAECRRKGQHGTVIVEFIVDGSGRVISAYAKSESPWALLNNEAVRTVRRWKFPPGGIMKLQRPIIFQLR